MFFRCFRHLTFTCLVVWLCSAAVFSAETQADSENIKIFSGEPRLLIVNGYSTSFHWWAFLQRKIDRYVEYKDGPDGRVVEVQSVTKGGTPISGWMNVDTGGRSVAWRQVLIPTIKKEKGKRPVIILAQQSLQRAFPADHGAGIRNADDTTGIKHGADVLERYAKNLLEDGAAAIVIGMHIYKKGMEPGIGNERLALAELIKRNIPHVHAGPDVWEPTSKQHPLAFDTDRRHPNYIGAEMMAHYWFAALLEREGLKVPDWSREEMEDAIENKPLGITRDRQRFEEKLKEWKIVNRRPATPQTGQRDRLLPGGRGAGRQVPSRILQRYDKDGDGKLNEEERAAFEKARQQRARDAAGSTNSYHSPG